MSNFFADVSSKIIALANPVLSQPDMEREMVSPPAGADIPSFTIYHVLPDLHELQKPRTGSFVFCVFGTGAYFYSRYTSPGGQ